MTTGTNTNGFYVQLESIYRSAPVVSNICVHADSTRAKPFAIILPVEKELNRLLSGNKGNGSLLSFTDTAVAQQLVLEQLQQQARNYDLASMEIVEVVVLSDLNEWNPMNVSTI
jgi:long-chain acyl-CoA synthetase